MCVNNVDVFQLNTFKPYNTNSPRVTIVIAVHRTTVIVVIVVCS